MGGVNWALGLQQSNPGESFANAFAQGQQRQQQDMAKQALAALVQNPNNPQALAALAKVSPETAMQFRQQQASLVKEQLAQHQDSILKGAEILRQFNPQDQQSYSAALQAAQQAGIDVSQVPQQFNPQYVQGVIHLADALKPESDPNNVIVTPQQGAAPPVMFDKRTHGVTQIFAPNEGGHNVGDPVSGGVPSQAVEYLKANPSLAPAFDQKYGAGASARILSNGGQTATPSATFP